MRPARQNPTRLAELAPENDLAGVALLIQSARQAPDESLPLVKWRIRNSLRRRSDGRGVAGRVGRGHVEVERTRDRRRDRAAALAFAARHGAAGTGRDPSVSESGPALPPPRARAGDPIGTRGPTNRAGGAACCSSSGGSTGNWVRGGIG